MVIKRVTRRAPRGAFFVGDIMARCSICSKKKGTFAFPHLLKAEGIDGKFAHPKCLVDVQNKRREKEKRRGLLFHLRKK